MLEVSGGYLGGLFCFLLKYLEIINLIKSKKFNLRCARNNEELLKVLFFKHSFFQKEMDFLIIKFYTR